MNSDTPQGDAPTPNPVVRRRIIAQGAAWAAPAIVLGAPVPAAATSCDEHGSYTQGPGTGSVTIPACVRTVTFTLVAGGGGGSAVKGGHGARIGGTLVLLGTAPTTLTFDIGYGGDGRNAISGSALSGRGYGDGGIGGIRFFNGAWRVDGGDGGGGSAILLGTTPVVVAGGGGGSGNGQGAASAGTIQAGGGGDAGPTPQNGTNAVMVGVAGTRREMEGGGAASGPTGGTAGDIGVGASPNRRLGAAGANGPGGNGGAGGSFVDSNAANAGGGGGGYAGGGGGEAGAFVLDGGDLRAGAGGGAGSSYVGGGGGISVSATITSAGNGGSPAHNLGGVNPLRGLHGSVSLAW